MFSIRISRCDVSWDPPLRIGDRSIPAMRDASFPLEWDVTCDTIDDYRYEARLGCNFATGPTTAHLLCFTPDGRTSTDDITCPPR
jgi:hypothetical protein